MRTFLVVIGALVVVVGVSVGAVAGGTALWWSKNSPPEAATGWNEAPSTVPGPGMVVAAHPLASEAGAQMLSRGGTAADAAVAIQAMLTLVEPQSSGIGGGAFALHYNARTQSLEAWDGREKAPQSVTDALFLRSDGTPMNFIEALVGGRSVGVPGVIAMLAALHRSQGSLPWSVLFEPAIRAADEGFEVSPRLHHLLRRDPLFRTQPSARELFYPSGLALVVGTRLQNHELANVFRAVARHGPDAFYRGEVAEAIVKTVQRATQPAAWETLINTAWIGLGLPRDLGLMASEPNPGLLTLDDLAEYQAKERSPLCIEYRVHWRICGFPPPTSGGITTLQIMGLLSHFDLTDGSVRGVDTVHLLLEASKLAYADRAAYIGDPDFVDVPTEGLLDADYLASRAKLIDPARAAPKASPGHPAGAKPRASVPESSLPSTSHFSVADELGNVLSMTTSVENVFGSRLVVRGFVLNNQLTDFSFVPERDGQPVANAVRPGKRPRSSMAPVIVFDRRTDDVYMALGSPGGSRIIGYVASVLVSVLDFGLSPQAALHLPHVLNRNGVTEIEDRPWGPGERADLVSKLEARGHEVRGGTFTSGVHALVRTDDGWLPGVDPRREGEAVGVTTTGVGKRLDRDN
ncbi:MAG: gamma-glutamyltransferase family protein [Myxococcota bacterium]